MGKDRRRFLRFDTSLGMRYKVPFTVTGGGAALNNISRNGMGLSTAEGKGLFSGVPIDFEIYIPGENQPVSTKGRIMWSKEIFKKGSYSLTGGVEFTDMKPFDKNTLLDYAYDQWLERELLRNNQ